MVKSFLLTILCLGMIMFFVNAGYSNANQSGMDMKSDSTTNSQIKAEKKVNEQKLKSPQAKIGDTVLCPVFKTKMVVKKDSLYAEYKGKKYYVCCSDCVNEFKKNPEKYVK